MPSSKAIDSVTEVAMEGSHPAQPAEPGTLKASLLEIPCIEKMTEKESAHPINPSRRNSKDEVNTVDRSYDVSGGREENKNCLVSNLKILSFSYNTSSL